MVNNQLYSTSKIVGYMQVRNEENIIEQALRCLALYVDGIVVLDDASTDNTPHILAKLKSELPIELIISNTESAWLTGKETDNMQKLLDAGRAVGGTHFVFMDADEIISSNCLSNNFLRNIILSLKSGDKVGFRFLNLWRSANQYRSDSSPYGACNYRFIIFCDYPGASYKDSFLHGSRFPAPLPGKEYKLPDCYAVLHFQFVNWENLLVKQAWYRCLERVKNIQAPDRINQRYRGSKDENYLALSPVNPHWVSHYDNFDMSVYDKPVAWRKKQVLEWFGLYGKDYFAELDIWDIDWDR